MNENEMTHDEVLGRVFEDSSVPIHLLYRLSDMTPQEHEAFEQRWQAADPERRRVIARHLADISEENFVVDFSPVFRYLLEDVSADVRMAALDGLWDCSNNALVPPIVQLMRNDQDERVRALAAATLGHVVIMAEWGQMDLDVAQGAVDALLEQYLHPEASEAVRRAALESLGASADVRVPELIHNAYYGGGGPGMQLSAVFAMGRTADARWLPVILEELESSDLEMQIEAARAAGGIGHSDAVEKLVQLLDEEDLELALAAVYALGQIGSQVAYEALQEVAEDPYTPEEMQEAAERALDEMTWLTGEFDFSLFSWEDDDLEDEDGEDLLA